MTRLRSYRSREGNDIVMTSLPHKMIGNGMVSKCFLPAISRLIKQVVGTTYFDDGSHIRHIFHVRHREVFIPSGDHLGADVRYFFSTYCLILKILGQLPQHPVHGRGGGLMSCEHQSPDEGVSIMEDRLQSQTRVI